MKTKTTLCIAALLFCLAVSGGAAEQPRVELAILLDTSSSMDGLIDQARSQLWQVVNELTQATRSGDRPLLSIALYEYGNDGLAAEGGHVRRVLAFTDDLDRVSEELFALTTNGGSEFCGKVIADAIRDLHWSASSDVLKLIFIAGNEPFNQGPTDFRAACKAAIQQGVLVNTIHCGDHASGVSQHWQEGAQLADGEYLSINQNQVVRHIAAPQDDEIARLNNDLNETYVAYGAMGDQAKQRQIAQDANAQGVSAGTNAARAKTKASASYLNTSWDLVDATANEVVQLEQVDTEDLPEEMQSMSDKERQEYIEAKRAERQGIQKKIQELSEARDRFVAQERAKEVESGGDTLDQAMIKAIHEQGSAIGLEFEGTP